MDAEPRSLDDDNAIARIAAIVRAAKRVDFSKYRRSTIERRIRQRMLVRHLSDLEEYARLLEREPDEVAELYDRLLILTTSFFRDPDSFDVLKERFLRRLFRQRKQAGAIRVWSAACSTGEEAYSIAILLLEAAADAASDAPIHVFASDVSERALARARRGAYGPEIAEDVSAERLERFFARTDDGYRVRGAVRDICSFARQDLTQDPPFSHLDLVLCRNVLMFMGEELQQRVLASLHYALRSGGVLMLGRNEAIGRRSAALFETLDSEHRIYGKIGKVVDPRRPWQDGAPVADSNLRSAPARAVGHTRETAWIEDAGRRLVGQRAASGVLVDDRFRVLRFYGQTGRYLEPPPGPPTYDMLAMAREGLEPPLRAALVSALAQGRAQGEAVLRRRITSDSRRATVGIEVTRLDGPPVCLLVLFHDVRKRGGTPRVGRRSK
jgi:two-component system CheB/CheR fusion protein